MKLRKTCAILALITASFLQSSAQSPASTLNEPNYNKAKVFADLPDKMPLRIADLETLLNLPVGARVNATVSAGFPLVGTVVSKSDPADKSVKSVVINVPSRQGATFTFTRITEANGKTSYIGRMLNKANGDALEIAQEGEGYVIRKKALHDLINE